MNEAMANLLVEKQAIQELEEKIRERKERLAKLALEVEAAAGDAGVGNIFYEGMYYAIRKRQGNPFVLGPRKEKFGSWRRKKKESPKKKSPRIKPHSPDAVASREMDSRGDLK